MQEHDKNASSGLQPARKHVMSMPLAQCDYLKNFVDNGENHEERYFWYAQVLKRSE
jgi:hypothetical protein